MWVYQIISCGTNEEAICLSQTLVDSLIFMTQIFSKFSRFHQDRHHPAFRELMCFHAFLEQYQVMLK